MRTVLLVCGGRYHENYAWAFFFFCSSVFISVCVFNVWPKTTLPPMGPRDAERSAAPALGRRKGMWLEKRLKRKAGIN